MSNMSRSDPTAILEHYDAYINHLAQKHFPYKQVSPDLDWQDLAQNVKLKLFLALTKQEIIKPKAYIYTTLYHEIITMTRQRCAIQSLDSTPEAFQEPETRPGMTDPALTVEHAETIIVMLSELDKELDRLPNRQRQALLCSLKDEFQTPLLKQTLPGQQAVIEKIQWPEDRRDRHCLKAAITVLRKKLSNLHIKWKTTSR